MQGEDEMNGEREGSVCIGLSVFYRRIRKTKTIWLNYAMHYSCF